MPRAHVFPEIAGDAALWYEPGNTREMRQCLIRLANSTLRAALISQAQSQSRRFTWSHSATTYLTLYQNLANQA